MAVRVKYFGSLRERMGRAEDSLTLESEATVAEIWARVSNGQPLPANLLAAVNLEYAQPGQVVADGDEVAFFPPVTGG
jgi:molybdopterin synthase sulfur carrier subunit